MQALLGDILGALASLAAGGLSLDGGHLRRLTWVLTLRPAVLAAPSLFFADRRAAAPRLLPTGRLDGIAEYAAGDEAVGGGERYRDGGGGHEGDEEDGVNPGGVHGDKYWKDSTVRAAAGPKSWLCLSENRSTHHREESRSTYETVTRPVSTSERTGGPRKVQSKSRRGSLPSSWASSAKPLATPLRPALYPLHKTTIYIIQTVNDPGASRLIRQWVSAWLPPTTKAYNILLVHFPHQFLAPITGIKNNVEHAGLRRRGMKGCYSKNDAQDLHREQNTFDCNSHDVSTGSLAFRASMKDAQTVIVVLKSETPFIAERISRFRLQELNTVECEPIAQNVAASLTIRYVHRKFGPALLLDVESKHDNPDRHRCFEEQNTSFCSEDSTFPLRSRTRLNTSLAETLGPCIQQSEALMAHLSGDAAKDFCSRAFINSSDYLKGTRDGSDGCVIEGWLRGVGRRRGRSCRCPLLNNDKSRSFTARVDQSSAAKIAHRKRMPIRESEAPMALLSGDAAKHSCSGSLIKSLGFRKAMRD
ncbi:hypothetical protein BDK51DRAFT_30844 [Blyttiomyces helicus]|uniref:Uncharacterized protein n=1 Tax=Blyttiomyces helicus TaxID=388810 RepID=A0A4P9WJ76_9FUNG|nr:hypothetical protein BDK51DRAFT_30844 [Blyttiomyces helicus]|eukprot:RKO91190.1 hypothetical protein BDK51DRAFT_30844 [Blyttiomyces helicus]